MTRDLSPADRVWNRAALESGGPSPGLGDQALASLLLFHGLAMNGGVHHAVGELDAAGRSSAIEGYSYFGLDAVAEFLRAMSSGRCARWTEEAADRRYAELIPDDAHLAARFEAAFRDRPESFAPVER